MAIFKPGEKYRYHRLLSRRGSKRGVTAELDLTAMVDMFTVLVVFLLQNFNATGEVIFIPKEVTLPKAESTKELTPATVVTISSKEILLGDRGVISFDEVKNQVEWNIPKLQEEVKLALEKARIEQESKLQNQVKNAVDKIKGQELEDRSWSKVTIQADKGIDFLTIKKVLSTVTEAGAGEISFAVTKVSESAAE